MARTKNSCDTVQVTVSLTTQQRDLLEQFTRAGLYGKNVADTAADLLRAEIRRVANENNISPDFSAPDSTTK